MKTRNLLLSIFAFAALCSCNKEVQPETPQMLGDDACLSVRIMAADVNTKATGDFEVGSDKENAVTNVLFAFFTADGKFMYTREYASFTWNNVNETDPNIEKQSNATVVLDGKTIAPRQMVVVLNYNSAIKTAVEAVTNISEMYSAVTTTVYGLKTNTEFVMTNSSYAMLGGTVNMFAAQIDETDIYEKGQTPTASQIVDVYVERVAAKLSVETSASLATTSKELELYNGETIKYYPQILGYAFTGTKNASYLCKNLESLYTDFNTNWSGWNDPTNRRSYWGVSYPSANSAYVGYDDITNSSPYSVYCHENMTTAHTKLIVKTVIRKQSGAEQDPAVDPVLSLVKVGATYYLKSDLEAAIVDKLATEGVVWNDGSADQAYAASHIKYTPITGGTGYEVKIELDKTPTDVSKAKAIMDKYAAVLLWDEGQSYFSTKIEHLGNASTTPASDYGVVRNHVYKLSVNKIAGLGTPYVPGIGGDGGDPVVPAEIEYELQAKINILKWKVVEQGVSFE